MTNEQNVEKKKKVHWRSVCMCVRAARARALVPVCVSVCVCVGVRARAFDVITFVRPNVVLKCVI